MLHSFKNDRIDGYQPIAGLIFDAVGNLYGVTSTGGTNGGGTVYQMTPQTSGNWVERVIHSFNATGTTGITPVGKLALDSAGSLYGATYWGGIHDAGTVFEMKRKSGIWIERELYSFGDNAVDGVHPDAGLVFDAAGNLYGTTFEGGTVGRGTLFELGLHINGSWTEKVLHHFHIPDAELIIDPGGNLYGTTSRGGVGRGGTVFEFTP